MTMQYDTFRNLGHFCMTFWKILLPFVILGLVRGHLLPLVTRSLEFDLTATLDKWNIRD